MTRVRLFSKGVEKVVADQAAENLIARYGR